MPKLSDSDQQSCEGNFTVEEFKVAIGGMANFKTPGMDGLPKEFYAKFFYLFGREFVEMVNLCFHLDQLPPSQRECLITLLCKDLAQRIYLSFWRPISLLNVDYKISAKAKANRLKCVMGSIIHSDQTCSIPGRSMEVPVHGLDQGHHQEARRGGQG